MESVDVLHARTTAIIIKVVNTMVVLATSMIILHIHRYVCKWHTSPTNPYMCIIYRAPFSFNEFSRLPRATVASLAAGAQFLSGCTASQILLAADAKSDLVSTYKSQACISTALVSQASMLLSEVKCNAVHHALYPYRLPLLVPVLLSE